MQDYKKNPAAVGANRLRSNIKHSELLMGYVRGIMADDVIHEKEIEGLVSFLEKNKELKSKWPGDLVYERCNAFLRNDMQGHSLMDFFRELASDDIKQSTSLPLDLDVNELIFKEMKFCFTGEFQFGTRNQCHKIIVEVGAGFTDGVTKETNYLVIGQHSNADWFNCSYGRKIEKAMEYKQKTGILILGEAFWKEELDKILNIKKAS